MWLATSWSVRQNSFPMTDNPRRKIWQTHIACDAVDVSHTKQYTRTRDPIIGIHNTIVISKKSIEDSSTILSSWITNKDKKWCRGWRVIAERHSQAHVWIIVSNCTGQFTHCRGCFGILTRGIWTYFFVKLLFWWAGGPKNNTGGCKHNFNPCKK